MKLFTPENKEVSQIIHYHQTQHTKNNQNFQNVKKSKGENKIIDKTFTLILNNRIIMRVVLIPPPVSTARRKLEALEIFSRK